MYCMFVGHLDSDRWRKVVVGKRLAIFYYKFSYKLHPMNVIPIHPMNVIQIHTMDIIEIHRMYVIPDSRMSIVFERWSRSKCSNRRQSWDTFVRILEKLNIFGRNPALQQNRDRHFATDRKSFGDALQKIQLIF